jgi:serine-type D-Ala-D-Ala carboxypeptidase
VSSLEDFLADEIHAGSFPGGVAVRAEGDHRFEVAVAGDRVTDPVHEAVDTETLYDLASLTKVLVTTPLLLLAMTEHLAPETPVGKILPEFGRTQFCGVTVAHLLTHTSGLPAWRPLFGVARGAREYRRRLAELEPVESPGRKVIYSDLGFLILGDVVETVLGGTLDRLFAEAIGRPLGLSCGFGPIRDPSAAAATERGNAYERRLSESLGYPGAPVRSGVTRGQVHDSNAYFRGGVAGHAGLFANAADVFALARMWTRPDTGPLDSGLVARAFEDHTPDAAEARGWGWQGRRGAASAGELMASGAFGHTGFTGTSLWIEPRSDRVCALLTNRIHPTVEDVDFNAVRRRFHDRCFGSVEHAPTAGRRSKAPRP